MENKGMKRKGQITIFVIIALVIIGFAILIYVFYPKISEFVGIGVSSPQAYLENCIEDKFDDTLETVSMQGGGLAPENYILYDGNKIEYLCYIDSYYETCVMQKPLVKNYVETEIEKGIANKVEECVSDLKNNYQKKGYSVSMSEGGFSVELLPERVVLNIDKEITLKKGEEVQSFGGNKKLNVIFNNNIYELTSIASSILNSEATYGDAETTIYMDLYHNLKVEKYKQSDGSTIYILTDSDKENKFQFASRSVAWPPGYGINE